MHVKEAGHEVAREFAHSTHAQVLADVPGALFSYWSAHSQDEFPCIPRDASFFAQAAEGLVTFFDLAAAARKPCALPSRAADSVWHAWLRMDAAGLQRFCIRHFGKTIPHVERAQMSGGIGEAMAMCLVQARRRAAKPPAGTHLPRLFSLDSRLGMPFGFGYRIVGGLVAYCALDVFGNPDDRMVFPEALAPESLALLGLVGKQEYDDAMRQARLRDDRPGGGDAWSSAAESGADGSDGGSGGDGGGSCGGGCGCGGGGCSS